MPCATWLQMKPVHSLPTVLPRKGGGSGSRPLETAQGPGCGPGALFSPT